MTKTKKMILAGAVLFAVLVCFVGYSVHVFLNNENAPVLRNTITIEYGQPADFSADDLFDGNADKVESFRIASGLPMETNPKPGSYDLEVCYVENGTSRTGQVNLEVLDTTAPVIKNTEISAGVNEDIDWIEALDIRDTSEITLDAEDENVDYTTPGVYTLTVTASDEAGNSTSEEISLTLLEEGTETTADDAKDSAQAEEQADENNSQEAAEPVVVTSSDGSPTVINGIPIVNKKYPVSASYAPGEDPTAKAALMRLITDMQNLGYNISNQYSGFRSYEYQSQLYNNYVAANGQAQADTFSARPGYSEHQTGLAYDVKHYDGSLVTGDAEAAWIAAHAHEYGFIVRYQEGWESITGYMAEPWHLRYIGDEATAIYESGLPLETYLGALGGDNQ